jgi:hypothetical protein
LLLGASPPISTVTGTHMAHQKSSTPLPTNQTTPSSNNNNNNNNNNNKGKSYNTNPFLTEPIIAPLATSEVSPGITSSDTLKTLCCLSLNQFIIMYTIMYNCYYKLNSCYDALCYTNYNYYIT